MVTWLSVTALLSSLLALLVVLATRHASASRQCRRGIDLDGVERDFWSFSGGYDNTLIGQTIGKAYVRLAEWCFSLYQRRIQQD